jgi:selenocysteine lyase/cysteine desulfurase
MKEVEDTINDLPETLKTGKKEQPVTNDSITEAFTELVHGVHAALETYSNVHRGSGHNSMVSTFLFEQARNIILEYLGLSKKKYVVIFCTPRRARMLMAQLNVGSYHTISSQDIGLSLGIRALVVHRTSLPKGVPVQTGGGTASLVSRNWVIWANAPDKFEAGTPAIINVIAFAKALLLIRHFGINSFKGVLGEQRTADGILYHDELEKYSGLELLDKLQHTLIGRGIRVPTQEGSKPFINLDNGASTPTFTPIWNAAFQSWHQPRKIQQEIIREVRSLCAKTLGAPLTDYDILFTSNTTEAINLVAESFQKECILDKESIVVNTLLEHNSNELPWRMIPGASLIRLSVDAEGFVDLNELETLLRSYNQEGKYGKKRIKLVTVSGASNVLGACNDLAEIARIVHLSGARLLVDAAQLVAHRKVEMERCGIDYLAFSAHKVYAPFGTGVLVARKGLLNFNSEEMELILSSGEENIGGLAALGKALILLQRIGLDVIQKEEQILTARLLRGLSNIPGLTLYGIKDANSPRFAQKSGVAVFDIQGMMANQVGPRLAERGGIGVRFGCHCAHIIIKRLLGVGPFLERFQYLIVTLFPNVKLPGVTRVSLGIENTQEDVDTLIDVLSKITPQKQNEKDQHTAFQQNETLLYSPREVRRQIDDFVKATARKIYV